MKLMKKLTAFFVIFWLGAALWAQNVGTTLYVAAKTVEVKSSSGFFARVIGTLAMGEAVTLQQNQGKWLFIRSASGIQGYVPADAFSTRRIVNSGYGASLGEFALAGKGFNDDLEKFLFSSGELDYTEVDGMEKYTVEREELRAFLSDGRLTSGD
jgi:uncharacterized protein YgiM (DUF1202 family)